MKLSFASFIVLFLLVSCNQFAKNEPNNKQIEISSTTSPNSKFNSSINWESLLDGNDKTSTSSEGDWLCFSDAKINIQLDYKETKRINHFEISFLTDSQNGIVLPSNLLIEGAKKEEPFFEVAKLNSKNILDLRNNKIRFNFKEQSFDVIRLSIENERQLGGFVGISEIE
jgi:hypothetical protein